MRRILLLLTVVAIGATGCKKEVPFYPKKIGEIEPAEWMLGEWESTDGNANLGLVITKDNIIKDGVNYKKEIEGQEILFQDNTHKNIYIHVYELKTTIKADVTYDIVETTTIYNEDGTIAKDNKGKDRIKTSKKEYKKNYIAKWFKSSFVKSENKKETYLSFQPIFVDGALGEERELYGENQVLFQREKEIKEEQAGTTVKLKEKTIREIINFKFETLEGTTQEEFIKLVTPRQYQKK